jgi:hypothetical protein
MARAKPMVLDFSRCADYGHRVMFNALPHPIEVSGPVTRARGGNLMTGTLAATRGSR